MAQFEEKSAENGWPSEPKHYQWKGTITEQNGAWYVLAHCRPRREDVFMKIRCFLGAEDLDAFTAITSKLINIRHPNLMTPVHAFVSKSEIFVVYPRHSGGAIPEIMGTHYPNGIPKEDIVACILFDAALGLQNLHKHQQCHRNIRAASLHIDIDEGTTLLTNCETLKEIKFKRAKSSGNRVATHSEFTDPRLGIMDDVTWYHGDIYSFGITALQLVYGAPPQINAAAVLQGDVVISTAMYKKPCPFSKSFESLIKECCGPLTERIAVNQLVDHKFFKGADCPNPGAVSKFLGHLLLSTEQRINPSLGAPPSLKKKKEDGAEDAAAQNILNSDGDDVFAEAMEGGNDDAEAADAPSSPALDEFAWSFTTTNLLALESSLRADAAPKEEESQAMHSDAAGADEAETERKSEDNGSPDEQQPGDGDHAVESTKHDLRKWMESNNVFEQSLFDTLNAHRIETVEELKAVPQQDLDGILQRVRVSRLAAGQTPKEVDSQLVQFERVWLRTEGKQRKKKKKGGDRKKGGDPKKGGSKKKGGAKKKSSTAKKKGGDAKKGSPKQLKKKKGAKKGGKK